MPSDDFTSEADARFLSYSEDSVIQQQVSTASKKANQRLCMWPNTFVSKTRAQKGSSTGLEPTENSNRIIRIRDCFDSVRHAWQHTTQNTKNKQQKKL